MYDAVLSFASTRDAILLLADAAAKSVVLLGAAALACVRLRYASAAVRHLIWASALGAALVVPALSLVVPGITVLPDWARLTQTRFDDASARGDHQIADSGRLNANAGAEEWRGSADSGLAALGPTAVSRFPGVADSGRLQRVPTRMVLLWAVGAAVCLLPLALGSCLTFWLPRKFPALSEGALVQRISGMAEQLGMRSPRSHIGPTGIMPMVWGIGRGHLLLPADAVTWDSERLRAVLLHELAHLRRRDPLWMLVGQLARVVYWFNPLAWLAVSRMRIEREQACDDCVLNGDVRPSDYAASLLKLVSSRRVAGIGSVALSMAAASRIEVRLRSILDADRDRRGVSQWTAVITLAATCVSIAALSFARAGADVEREVSAPPAEKATGDEQTTRAPAANPPAEPPKPPAEKTANFLIFPITTGLQRHLVNFGPGKESENAKAYVLVNGMSVIAPDGTLDEPALGLDEIRKGLEQYRDPESGSVYFNVYYDLSKPAEGGKELLMWALQGFGKHVGFKSARVSNSYQGEDFDWIQMVKTVNGNSDVAGVSGSSDTAGFGAIGFVEGKEPMSGDDQVQVYPVRTRLSRFLTGNSDCVIDYLTPIDEASDVPLAAEIEAAMKASTSTLDLKQRKKLLIRVTSTTDEGRKAVDRLVEIERNRLTKELGFDFISINHTPQ